MKAPFKVALATALVLGMTSSVSAMMLDASNAYGYYGKLGAPTEKNPTAADLDVWLGVADGSLKDLYKANNDGTEDYELKGSYETQFTPPDENEYATISYVTGDVPAGKVFALAKDGVGSPTEFRTLWYVWDLSALGWNGTETLEFAQLWPANGSFSHVALMGTSTTNVPDGGTSLLLLGMAVSVIGLFRKRA